MHLQVIHVLFFLKEVLNAAKLSVKLQTSYLNKSRGKNSIIKNILKNTK